MKKETIYIKGDQSVEVKHFDVTIGDLLQLECSNPDVVPKVKSLKVFRFREGKEKRAVISILKIMECIHQQYPELDIENVGEADIIVTLEEQKKENPCIHWLKVIGVIAITFSGAAFSIMTFNNDVDTSKLFGQIYEWFMGSPSNGFTVLELTYCIGLIVGILAFFHHFGGKRFSVDPTPMEVEMRLYENDIQTTVIEDYSRKGKELDVGQTNATGNHRN